eukprot:TRINITY_DN23794_c0_g1_i1.p1 TRINITY_DN23794_c0_g1~~TRINITY_DN23794_c0_g1_i1.p1  ORF type:complete len:743 (-),score=283.02 TRINITY_DN23794_c0_g1_i1:190-2418(-)
MAAGGGDASMERDCTEKLNESLVKAIEIESVVQQLARAHEDADRRLEREIKAHSKTREKAKVMEEEYQRMRSAIDKELQSRQAAQNRLAEIERFQAKSGAALKAMNDDLMAVRAQNENLQAEMEVQTKAFVVNVSWENMYNELKAKHDLILQEHENLYAEYINARGALDQAKIAEESSKLAMANISEAIVTCRDDLAKGDELIKVAAATMEMAGELGSLDALKEKLAAGAAARKKQRESARQAMEKSLNDNQQSFVTTVFTGWKDTTAKQKFHKERKAQNQAMAMRGIANSGMALVDFCLTAWHKDVAEEKVKRMQEANRELQERLGGAGAGAEKARQKAIAQLERQFGNAEKGLLRETYTAWMNVKLDRMKLEKATAVAARSIAANGSALLQQCFQSWGHLILQVKAKREKKAGGMARGMRMIADGDNALKDFCLTQWAGLTKTSRAKKKQSEASNVKAARMIGNNNQNLIGQVFVEWSGLWRKKKDRNKKMKAVERNLAASMNGQMEFIFFTWKHDMEKSKKVKGRKEASMKQTLKKINISQTAIWLDVFVSWAKETSSSFKARLEAELDEKRNQPVVPDENTIKLQQEIADLMVKEKAAMETMEEVKNRIPFVQTKMVEFDELIKEREKQVAKASQELTEARRKAREINEELVRVSTFLLSKPLKRPSSRPSSGTRGNSNGTCLPPLAGPLSAREPRPDSGRRKNSNSALDSAAGGAAGIDLSASQPLPSKQAWADGSV